MNSSDCAKRILLRLSGDGVESTQVALSQELDVPLDRLGPVVAGLAHNRYLIRDFNIPGVLVSLTDEGRKWASSLASGPDTTSARTRNVDQDTGVEDKSGILTMDRQRKRTPTTRSASSSAGQGLDRTPQVAKIVRRPRRAIPAA